MVSYTMERLVFVSVCFSIYVYVKERTILLYTLNPCLYYHPCYGLLIKFTTKLHGKNQNTSISITTIKIKLEKSNFSLTVFFFFFLPMITQTKEKQKAFCSPSKSTKINSLQLLTVNSVLQKEEIKDNNRILCILDKKPLDS